MFSQSFCILLVNCYLFFYEPLNICDLIQINIILA